MSSKPLGHVTSLLTVAMFITATPTVPAHIGPATRCDKTWHFPAILGFWKHRRPSKTIAGIGPATRCDEMGRFSAILNF